MNEFGLDFHHLGLAVRKSDTAISFVRGLGYAIGEPIYDMEQNVNLILCSHVTAPAIEIIFPGNGKGPIDALVARHENGIVYHCCYVSKNLEVTLEAISTSGLRAICVSSSKPAILFGGEKVSFYQVAGVGLVEIIESKKLIPDLGQI